MDLAVDRKVQPFRSVFLGNSSHFDVRLLMAN